jgi:hypothetical protein
MLLDTLHWRTVAHHAVAASWRVVRLPVGAVAPTAPAQRAALVDFFIATNGTGWTSNGGWVSYATGSDPCDHSWSAVTCSGATAAVPNRNM